MTRDASHVAHRLRPLDLSGVTVEDAAYRVLQFPAVADKTFLVTIGDRTVGGLCSRDPMVGPWQVPVADAAVTLMDFDGYRGEAMAIGERTPLALIDAAASCRMAVAEAVTNIAASGVTRLTDLKLSANWMAPAGHPGEDAALYDGGARRGDGALSGARHRHSRRQGLDVDAHTWRDQGRDMAVTAPVSLIVTAFAPVEDVRRALTPLLRRDAETPIRWIDLGAGRRRLGGSALAQVYGQLGDVAPDLDDPVASPRSSGRSGMCCARAAARLSRHRRRRTLRDGVRNGVRLTLRARARTLDSVADPLATLFAEELGAVVQVGRPKRARRGRATRGGRSSVHAIGAPAAHDGSVFARMTRTLLDASRIDLHRAWSATTHALQRLRDNPECADQEYARLCDASDPGSSPVLTFDPADDIAAPYIATGARPAIAILREQGVNGQVEMAAAFDRAGFRGDRRAHDATSSQAAVARRFPRLRRGRRVFVRRRAGCRGRAGPSRFFTTRGLATTSRRSSSAMTRSRSACATVAR